MNLTTIILLIQRLLIENKKVYLIGAAVLFAFLFFLFLIAYQWQDSFSGAVQNGVFIIGLFVAGGVFSSTMFRELSIAQSTIWLLSIPAKPSEKVLVRILLSVPFFIIVYIILFYLAEFVYIYGLTDQSNVDSLDLTKNNFYQFVFQYLILNGFILLGGVTFTRYSLIKTILVGIILLAAINFINNGMLALLMPGISILSSILLDSFLFYNQGENITVTLSHSTELLATIFARIILPISLWFAVWLKLREKQVS